jgi:hypothetical protein
MLGRVPARGDLMTPADPPAMIRDPADRITPALADALARRYSGGLPPIAASDYDERFTAVCDAVIQVLWPEKYGTGPADPDWHTSAPARAIASVMLAAAGLTDQADGPEEGNGHRRA